MRPLALAVAATFAVAALACGGDPAPASPGGEAPAAVSGPQIFFVQIDT